MENIPADMIFSRQEAKRNIKISFWTEERRNSHEIEVKMTKAYGGGQINVLLRKPGRKLKIVPVSGQNGKKRSKIRNFSRKFQLKLR